MQDNRRQIVKIGVAMSFKNPGTANIVFWLFAAAVATTAVANGIHDASIWVENPHIVSYSRQLPLRDGMDIPPILASLAEKHTFGDTWSWYRESWQKPVAYWRPLLMQTWWIEKHVFTLDRYDCWVWLSIAANTVCIGMFGWVVFFWSGRRDLALLTTVLYAIPAINPGHLTDLGQPGNAWVAVTNWKDQPDVFADGLVFGSMLAMLRGRYVLAALCAALAVGFKESGWMAFPLDLVVLATTDRIKSLPRRVWIMNVAAAIVLIAFRVWAGPEMFVSYGAKDNASWPYRYLGVIGGGYPLFLTEYTAGSVLGHAVYVGVLTGWKRSLYLGLAAGLALALVAVLVFHLQEGMSLDVDFAALMDTRTMYFKGAIFTAPWLLALTFAAYDPALRRWLPVSVLCSMLAAVPYAAPSQIHVHVLHQAFAFQGLFVAVLILSTWRAIVPTVAKAVAHVGQQATVPLAHC